MVRFVHTADLQLGRAFQSASPEAGPRLREARLAAIGRIGEVVRERGAEFVLVAGDLFDSNRVPGAVVRDACARLGAVGVPVVVIPGNHDHGGEGSVYRTEEFRRAAGERVMVIEDREPRVLLGGRAVVFGCPLLHRRVAGVTTSHLSDGLGRDVAPDAVRIGLAHGSVDGFGLETESANRVEVGCADSAGLDYLALGDWHGLKQVAPRVWYSGAPEPDRFKDNDPGHVLVVEIEGPRALPRVEPVKVAQTFWVKHEAVVHSGADVDSLARVLEAIRPANRAVVALSVRGTLPIGEAARLREVLERWRGPFLDFQTDVDVAQRVTEAELATVAGEGFVGRAVADLQRLAASPDAAAEDAAEALAVLHTLSRGDAAGGGGGSEGRRRETAR